MMPLPILTTKNATIIKLLFKLAGTKYFLTSFSMPVNILIAVAFIFNTISVLREWILIELLKYLILTLQK